MPKPGRTQKQIAERYKGNLGYYRRLHPWRRTRLIVSLFTIFGGLVAIGLFQKHGGETFFNAGKISTSHAKFADDCARCHDRDSVTGRFTEVLRDRFRNGVAVEAIDRKCETCHEKHSFHEANVVQNRSCSACHQEHRGLSNLRLVASSQCATCHNNSAMMTASAEKGMHLPRDAFHRHPHPPQQIVFELPRPPQGFTATFASFWEAHPEFQLKRVSARDPDVLRFNHQRHFASDIPPVNGQKLDCAYCHQPQSDGHLMQRITFANNCQACHSLQFDWRNPEMRIPHGNVDLVRTFLRSLPAQYADYARMKRRIPEREIAGFIALDKVAKLPMCSCRRKRTAPPVTVRREKSSPTARLATRITHRQRLSSPFPRCLAEPPEIPNPKLRYSSRERASSFLDFGVWNLFGAWLLEFGS